MEGFIASISNGRINIGMKTRTLLVLWKIRYVDSRSVEKVARQWRDSRNKLLYYLL